MGIEIGNEIQNELEFALKKGVENLNERAREICIEVEEIRRDLECKA